MYNLQINSAPLKVTFGVAMCYKLIVSRQLVYLAIIMSLFCSCNKSKTPPSDDDTPDITDSVSYPGVPKSDIYEVSIIRGEKKEKLVVFKNSCPTYQSGYMNMTANDTYPLEIFAGRSISWVNFSFSGIVTIEVRVLAQSKVSINGPVKIFPSRNGITPLVEGDIITFTMAKPGQCSVEIGGKRF